MSAKISIIMPAYNEEKNIINTLECVCAQTFADIEIICVDDKSTDSTFEMITEFSQKDSRVVPLRNTGKGVASARNYGISKAGGEYIAFVDSDDSIHPQMMEFLLKAAEETGSNFALCSFTRDGISSDLYDFSYKTVGAEEIIEKAEMIFAGIWTKLIKKSFLDENKIRFESYKIGEDTVFSSELFRCNSFKNVPLVDFPLYYYKRNTGSTLANMNNDRRADMVLSRVRTFEILQKELHPTAVFYLEQALFYIVKYRQKGYFKDSPTEKKLLSRVFRKRIFAYLKSSEISLSNKLYVLVSYFFKNLSKKIYSK